MRFVNEVGFVQLFKSLEERFANACILHAYTHTFFLSPSNNWRRSSRWSPIYNFVYRVIQKIFKEFENTHVYVYMTYIH